jgi:DNA-binding IclR family transcriptional regulator
MTETHEVEAARSRSLVRRTIQVMTAFTTQSRWGVRELAAYLEIPKSGLHRTLQEMAAERLLQTDDDGGYEVTGELLRLASGLLQASDLTRFAREHIRAARDATGESVILVAYDDGLQQIVAVDTVQSAHAIQFIWTALREWTDLHLSASGLGILAELPKDDVKRYFKVPRVDLGGEAVTLESIEPTLDEIRERGWAISRSQRIVGSTGVCSAIRNGRGEVIGGVVIAWPNREEQDIDSRSIGRAASDAAGATSAALGWSR